MTQIDPWVTVSDVCWPVGIGLSDRHDCEGMPPLYQIVHFSGGWSVYPRWTVEEYLIHAITHCPWCGEKLPEVVVTPPALTPEQVKKYIKQMKKVAREVMRWMEEQADKR